MGRIKSTKVITVYSIINYIAAVICFGALLYSPILDILNLGFVPITVYFSIMSQICYSPGIFEIYLLITFLSMIIFSGLMLKSPPEYKERKGTENCLDKINPVILVFSAAAGTSLLALQLGIDKQVQVLGMITVLELLLVIILPVILRKTRRGDKMFLIITIILAVVGIVCVGSYIAYAIRETSWACNCYSVHCLID